MHARVKELQRHHGCDGDVQMWTLTIDPKRHASPEAAWLDVNEQRRISRTMQAVGVTYYVAVIEWHRSGWPHWHVLCWQPVRSMRIPHADVERAWKQGICRYTSRHGRPMEWAINYATKYICKPDDGVPSWVMQRHHVRSVWGSRGWGPVCLVHADCRDAEDESGAGDEREDARTNGEAVAECAASCVALLEHVNDDGEVRRKYLGRIGVGVRVMSRLVGAVTGCCHRTRVAAVDWATWQRLRKSVPLVE
jgi:hypothetical protein